MSERKPKKQIVHKDILGYEIKEDSKLAVSSKYGLKLCSVIKFNPKMLTVRGIFGKEGSEFLVYPSETIIINEEDALAYILRGGKML